jgi:hypothetical protein
MEKQNTGYFLVSVLVDVLVVLDPLDDDEESLLELDFESEPESPLESLLPPSLLLFELAVDLEPLFA